MRFFVRVLPDEVILELASSQETIAAHFAHERVLIERKMNFLVLAEIAPEMELFPTGGTVEPGRQSVHGTLVSTDVVAHVVAVSALLPEFVVDVFATFVVVADVTFEKVFAGCRELAAFPRALESKILVHDLHVLLQSTFIREELVA